MAREFTLTFTMDNAAFDNDSATEEAARALRIVAGQALSGQEDGSIFDSNGNRIGSWSADWPELDDDEDDDSDEEE